MRPWVEIIYGLAGTASLFVGWGLLGDKWLAFVPIAFMAWGDTMSGLVSEIFIKHHARIRQWPSAAMLAACLAIAGLFHPYWIGAAGAIAATIFERFTPTVLGIRDDNWAIVGASLGLMAVMKTGAGI